MKNSQRFLDAFAELTGTEFININNYVAKGSGEVANHKINVQISVKNAKLADNAKLHALAEDSEALALICLANKFGGDYACFELALSELVASSDKNINPDITKRTKQSQAQTKTYINLTPAIRLCKETLEIHVFGQAISKKVISEGEYKTVNSANKTLAKKAISKALDLRAGKYRDFIAGRLDSVSIHGDTITLK